MSPSIYSKIICWFLDRVRNLAANLYILSFPNHEMKHNIKITLLLLGMFFITQLIGIFVVSQYQPHTIQITSSDGNVTNSTSFGLPYGMDPPSEVEPQGLADIAISFAIVFFIAVVLMLFLMKYKADILIKIWFFVVVILAIGTTLNSLINKIPYASLLAVLIAAPLAYFKIFKRNLVVHNITELIIYPGIASIFIAMLLSWSNSPILAISVILILISIYDMYAVWHSGFMQRMAQYQINNLRIFTGFFVPYLGKKSSGLKIAKPSSKKVKEKKVKVSVAILGGGDVVFPIILAGIVFTTLGLTSALIISLGATLALAGLFWLSEKGKFYPAMPFISAGCFIALAVVYLL